MSKTSKRILVASLHTVFFHAFESFANEELTNQPSLTPAAL
jgi:hypothetical protein